MKLQELAEMFALEIRVRRYSANRITVSLDREGTLIEFKENLGDGVLHSLYGDAPTQHEAEEDLCKQISGKFLVISETERSTMRYKLPRMVP